MPHRRRTRKAAPASGRAAVAAIARQTVKRMAEKKFIEIDINGTSITDVNANLALTPLARGFSDGTRNGDQVTIVKLELRLDIRSDTTANIGSAIRMIIFQWHPTDATPPDIDNVLLDTSITRSTQQGYLVDGRKNFTILSDKIFQVSTVAGTEFMHSVHTVITKGFRKNIDYNGTSVTGIDNCYLLAISDFGVATTPPLMFGGVRFTYIDV